MEEGKEEVKGQTNDLFFYKIPNELRTLKVVDFHHALRAMLEEDVGVVVLCLVSVGVLDSLFRDFDGSVKEAARIISECVDQARVHYTEVALAKKRGENTE